MIDLLLSFGNNLISEGIRSLLKSEKDIRVNTIRSPSDIVAAVKEKLPDVVVVDFFVLINFLHDFPDETQVLLLDTGCGKDNINYAYIAKNISGVISMTADKRFLIKAIRSVNNGHLWIDNQSTKSLLGNLSDLSKLWHLTEREQQILCLLARGMDDKLISEVLDIRMSSVKSYTDNLIKKIGVQDRWHLIQLSMQFDECKKSSNKIYSESGN